MKIRLAMIFALVISLACDDTSRDDYLQGRFGDYELAVPQIVGPVEGAAFVQNKSDAIDLRWKFRAGDNAYFVELATDAKFANITSRHTVQAPHNQLRLSAAALSEATYYWRVRSNVNPEGEWSLSFFNVHNDIIYVYCPEANICNDEGRQGTKNLPFQTIGRAVARAAADKITQVRIAARGGSAAYAETIYLASATSIQGGYNQDFSSQSTTGNPTHVAPTSGTALLAYNVKDTTVVEGLQFRPQAAGTAVKIQFCSEKFTLRGNIIEATAGSSSTALRLDQSPSNVMGNLIVTGSATMGSFDGIVIDNTSNALLANNDINCTLTTASITCLRIDNSSQPRIFNNTIHAGAAPTQTTGIALNNSASGFIENNIMFSSTTGGSPRMIKELVANADPTTVKNNNMFSLDGGTAFRPYEDDDDGCTLDGDGDGLNYTCNIADMEGLGDIASGVSGNVSIDDTGNQLFVNGRGGDGQITTASDNVWNLATPSAANCNVLFGGVSINGQFTIDIQGTTRTNNVASLPCTLSSPSDTLGQGWSMGAHERD